MESLIFVIDLIMCNQKYLLIMCNQSIYTSQVTIYFYKREFEWLDKDGYDESADKKREAIQDYSAASVNKKTYSQTKVFIYHYRILKEEDKQ